MTFIPQHSKHHYSFRKKIDFMPVDGWEKSHTKLTQDITTHIWSPCIWKGGYRAAKNFIAADWLVLDFDSGMRLGEAVERFCDIVHLIATTQSHTPDHHKFRVCLLFSRPITSLREFLFNMQHYTTFYECDRKCKDGARGYFPCLEVVSKNAEKDAYRIDVLEPKTSCLDGDETASLKPLLRQPEWTYPFINGVMVRRGERDQVLFRMLKDFRRLNTEKQDAIDYIKHKITFEDDPNDPFNSERIEKKATYIWRKFDVEER